jgi:hypothetical protein
MVMVRGNSARHQCSDIEQPETSGAKLAWKLQACLSTAADAASFCKPGTSAGLGPYPEQ